MKLGVRILCVAVILSGFVICHMAYAEEKAKEGNSAEQVLKTVVSIKTQVNRNGQLKDYGMGSGVLIGANGIILTNYHVVYEVDKILVKVPDEKLRNKDFEARVLKTSKYYDLALLTIATPNLPFTKMEDPGTIKTGMEVRAVGNPMGLDSTTTKGIVSAIRTNKDLGLQYEQIPGDYINQGNWENMTWIQTDAAINPGNSGGPLLNDKYQIIGINSFGYVYLQGLNFALHYKHIYDFTRGY